VPCLSGWAFFWKEFFDRTESGVIQCSNCKEEFTVVDGIYHFYRDRKSQNGVDYDQPDWPSRERDREKTYELEFGYNHEWLRSLPYPLFGPDSSFQKKSGALGSNFFDVLQRLELRGTESVLDMAAGTCWTSREFANRGCKVVSTDFCTIKYYGLRSSEAYFESGVYFERLCWAFGPIPFENATFDVVFCQNAFQYSQDLQGMLSEISRVLKPDGKFVLTWTGVRAPFKRQKWGPGHMLPTYLFHFHKCGLVAHVFPPLSLFDATTLVASRGHLWTLVAMLFSQAWEKSPFFRTALIHLFLPISSLIGIPFNVIAYKR
jgi:SAM-dependent methyltransferase